MELTVPGGTEAIVGIPKSLDTPKMITVDGWPVAQASHVRPLGEDDRWIKLAVPSGRVLIEALR